MSAKASVTSNLAAALLAGPWSVPDMVHRAAQAWGRRGRWLRRLAEHVLAAFGAAPTRPEERELAAFIGADAGFERAWCESCRRRELPLRQVFWRPDSMAPAAGAPACWNVPALTCPGQLAAWLGLPPRELDWLADCQGRTRLAVPGPLRHYTYRWLRTRRGKVRLLEVPKARLKAVQRRLLREILDRMPPQEAAHGYRRGRSVASYVAPHAGRPVVVHLDLRHFFPSIPASRVHALFRTAGYPRDVARLLTGLCTNAVPEEVVRARPPRPSRPEDGGGRQLLSRHLPQGAPTSPALANLCAYRLDCRLAGLGRSVGASYTRYADDLVFSGGEGLGRCLRRFHVSACRIALEEGFEVNTHKSHFMRQGVRQQVAGIVLNAHPNLRRADFDRLKAILTNCLRHGPRGENRERRPDFRAYLAGRVAYFAMINPSRGQRLRALFERIPWPDGIVG
jgi:hypothetical protein